MPDSKGSSENKKIDAYGATYGNFAEQIYTEIRREAFGDDIGQNSWLTSNEQDQFISWLKLNPESHVLDVGCGAGGPTLRLARLSGSNVLGIDREAKGIKAATVSASTQGLSTHARFQVCDASQPLSFPGESFDAVVCVDAIIHLPKRDKVLAEWARVLKPSGMVLFTDALILTGPVSNAELSIRTPVGYGLLVPPGENERLLSMAGFKALKSVDTTENTAIIAQRRYAARTARAEALVKIEGKEIYEGLQEMFRIAALLARERRLSRFAHLAVKKAS